MRRKLSLAALIVLLALLFSAALAEEAPAADEADEWTVLFYLCGSDLESKFSYATGNLEELVNCHTP